MCVCVCVCVCVCMCVCVCVCVCACVCVGSLDTITEERRSFFFVLFQETSVLSTLASVLVRSTLGSAFILGALAVTGELTFSAHEFL